MSLLPIPTYHNLPVTFNLSSPSSSTFSSSNATVHYTQSGSPHLPPLLLLHGFPSSSTQFRDFIPLLSENYHVLAPDLPGFGRTLVGPDFTYTFDNLASVISAWIAAVNLSNFALYVFDYGAPVGLRVASRRPSLVSALITQNGNSYVEGFGQEFWEPIFELWNSSNSEEARERVRRDVLTLEATKEGYTVGTPEGNLDLIPPSLTWVSDYQSNILGEDNTNHQLDLFYDYRTNVEMYPAFQKYFRESKVPILAVWGKGDPAFIPAGAEAFKKDSPGAVVRFVDAAHFALETQRWEIARIMQGWLTSIGF